MLQQRIAKPTALIVAIASILAVMAVSFTFPAATFAQQPPPHAFPGSATIDGVPVPDGAVISAWIDGQQVASATVAQGRYTLLVEQPAGLSFHGKTITFRINGLGASQTAAWEQGGATVLALSASGSGQATSASPAQPAAVATTPAGTAARQGIFGLVTAIDGNVLLARTAHGEVRIQVTVDSVLHSPQREPIGLVDIRPGRRIAAVVTQEGGLQSAERIMLLPDQSAGAQVSVVHVTGVIVEANDGSTYLITDTGARIYLEFGLNSSVPASGTVATVVGYRNPETGALQVRSIQRIDRTLERLNNHVTQIQELVPDRNAQLHHLGQVQRILDRNSERQLELLERAGEHLPAESHPALEQALRNLHDADQVMVRAFNQALGLAAHRERDYGLPGNHPAHRLLPYIGPSLADLAAALGIPKDTQEARLSRGLTVAQIAADLGISRERLVEEVLARVRQRLQRLVEEGQITPEDAERILQSIRREAAEQLGQVFVGAEVKVGLAGVSFSVPDLAEILGLEPPQLLARLHRGESLVEIARQAGLSREQLIDAITSLARQRAQQLVEQRAMRPEDVERFLRHFLGQAEQYIHEASLHSSGRVEESGQPQRPAVVAPSHTTVAVDFSGISLDFMAVAEFLRMPPQELRQTLADGRSLEELARQQGVTLPALANALAAPMEERLRRMVSAGQLTEENAQRLLRQARESILKTLEEFRLSGDGQPSAASRLDRSRDPGPSFQPYPGIPFTIEDIAVVLGVSYEEVRGITGADLRVTLNEHGYTPEEFVAALQDLLRQRLQEQVARGQMDEARARRIVEELRQRLLQDILGRRAEAATVQPAPDRTDVSSRSGMEVSATVTLNLRQMADALGLSSQEVTTLLAQGQSIEAIAARAGLSIDRLVETSIEPLRARLERLTREGHLHESQARATLEEARRSMLQAIAEFQVAAQARLLPSDRRTSAVRDTALPAPDARRDTLAIAVTADLSSEEILRLRAQGYSAAEISEGVTAYLNELLRAGRLSPEEARRRLEAIQQLITSAFAGPLVPVSSERPTPVPHRAEQQATPTTRPAVDLANLLPRLASTDDVFHFLGLSQAAQELGYSRDSMRLRVQAEAEGRVNPSVQAGLLDSARARDLLADFDRQAQVWIDVIFTATISTGVEISRDADLREGAETRMEPTPAPRTTSGR